MDDDGTVQGYSEESITEHDRYRPRIDPNEDVRDDSTREPRGRERPPGSGGPGGIRIDVEDHGYRAPGEIGVSITKQMVTTYGHTKGCRGCDFALGKIGTRRNHTDACRKRFIDLSNDEGNEQLKTWLDKEFEKVTKRYLDHGSNEDPPEAKRQKPMDPNEPVISDKTPQPGEQTNTTGSKRTGSKQNNRT